MNQIVLFLAVYGVVFTLADAKILSRPRDWTTVRSQFLFDLIGCTFCLGFWVSLAVHAISNRALIEHSTVEWLWRTGLDGFAGATCCYLIDVAIMNFEAPT